VHGKKSADSELPEGGEEKKKKNPYSSEKGGRANSLRKKKRAARPRKVINIRPKNVPLVG